MYNASHYRRPSSFVWTVCKGDRVPEQLPPSHPLTSALGSVPLQASWMLQGSPAPLKEVIKKKKKKELFLCIVEDSLFFSLISPRSYHYSPGPFPCFEHCTSLSFRALLFAPRFGVTLANLHELCEGVRSLLCPWPCALPLSLPFDKQRLFTGYLTVPMRIP